MKSPYCNVCSWFCTAIAEEGVFNRDSMNHSEPKRISHRVWERKVSWPLLSNHYSTGLAGYLPPPLSAQDKGIVILTETSVGSDMKAQHRWWHHSLRGIAAYFLLCFAGIEPTCETVTQPLTYIPTQMHHKQAPWIAEIHSTYHPVAWRVWGICWGFGFCFILCCPQGELGPHSPKQPRVLYSYFGHFDWLALLEGLGEHTVPGIELHLVACKVSTFILYCLPGLCGINSSALPTLVWHSIWLTSLIMMLMS